MPEEKTKFSSFWGDMTVNEDSITKVDEDPKDPTATPPANKSVEAEHEGEGIGDDPTEESKTPEATTSDDKTEEEEEEEEESYEYTEDDISKAYGILEEEGILDLDEDEEFDATPKGIADAVGATVRNKLKAEIEKIPKLVQEFYSHVENGGDETTFKPSERTVGWDEFDTKLEGADDIALKAFYIGQGMTEQEAVQEIEDIEEDKKERKTEIAINSLVKKDKVITASRAKKIADDAKADENKAKKETSDLKDYIDNTSELAGFALDTKVRKDKFKDYLFKINPRTGKTQMQENMSSRDRRMTIAMLDFVNYNKADFKKELTTELTKTRKKKLSRYTDKGVKNTSGSKTVKGAKDANRGAKRFPTIFGSSTIEVED